MSSIASFEDVGPTKATRDMVVLPPALLMKEAKPVEIPDIRYVLQYRGSNGRIVDSRESDEPFDLTGDAFNDEEVPTKEPILEIITTVETSRKHCNNIVDIAEPDYSGSDEGIVVSEEHDWRIPVNNNTKEIGVPIMVVHSKHLINAFNAVIGSYPGTHFLGETVTFTAPYMPLIHHRDALSRYRIAQPACHDNEYAATTAKHIDVLLGYLEKTYGDRIREEEARHKRSLATFEWFWLLLKPGEVVYRDIQNVWTPFVIDTVGPWPPRETLMNPQMKSYAITCWNIEHSQDRMRRCVNHSTVFIWPGEQAIKTLEVVPAAFFPEDLQKQGGLSMAEKQIQIGKLYWELVQRPAYRDYDGQLVDKDGLKTGHLTGRVIVDAEGYVQHGLHAPNQRRRSPPPPMPHHVGQPPMHPGPPATMNTLPQFSPQCSCATCARENPKRDMPGPMANFEDLNPLEQQPPKNDLYFLVCSPSIPAFILADRRWGHVGLDHLSDVKCDTESFKYLVLDPGVKLTVKALIGKFASSDGKVSPWPNDFVRNKGEGRIFLLHGSPGVGKTCTAECVAELTRRPLLSITSGDLVPSVERSLSYFLTLGERYGALVLLDEADVYLEARRARDLKRNALVSVFLRALEYYRGVLFLTTNRVESFDPAFTSRIHVALHYRRLSDADRARIWANNFDRLERDSAGKVFILPGAKDYVFEQDGDGVDEMGKLRWNGREIRNALQTAVALAETEAVEEGLERVAVAERHLRQVVKMSRGFKEFLRKRRGYDEEDDGDSEDEQGSDDERGEIDVDGFP